MDEKSKETANVLTGLIAVLGTIGGIVCISVAAFKLHTIAGLFTIGILAVLVGLLAIHAFEDD